MYPYSLFLRNFNILIQNSKLIYCHLTEYDSFKNIRKRISVNIPSTSPLTCLISSYCSKTQIQKRCKKITKPNVFNVQQI